MMPPDPRKQSILGLREIDSIDSYSPQRHGKCLISAIQVCQSWSHVQKAVAFCSQLQKVCCGKMFEPRKALWIQHCQGEHDDDHNHDDGEHDHTHDDHHHGHNHDHDHGSLAAGSHEIMQHILVRRLKEPILHLAITSDQM